MKIEVNENAKKGNLPYPKLMIDEDGDVFMVLGDKEVIYFSKSGLVAYDPNWSCADKEDFNGTLTLSNEGE